MRRRLSFAVVALTVWTVGSALGTVGSLPTASAGNASIVIGEAHANFTPRLNGSKPIFILTLGSDARAGTPVNKGLSDSVHIVAINLKKRRVTIVGFPRDSWVNIPGYGMGKINSGMPRGGPPLTIKTVEQLTGIKLDYYILTSFVGVQQAIDAVGGLAMDVPFPMHDSYSRADFHPGLQRLNGAGVLAFARDRHSLVSGDFGRSEDQGRVMIAALTQLQKEFAKDPAVLFQYVGAGMRNVQTSMSLAAVMNFAFTALSFHPKQVVNIVLPGSDSRVGTSSVVLLSSTAKQIYADLKRDGVLTKASLRLAPSPTRNQPGCCK